MSSLAHNTISDVAGLKVGHAHDPVLKSGTTVILSDRPMTAAVHVMGGAPGTRETDLLQPDKTVQSVDAIILSGGSAFGLDAASGVMNALRQDGRGFSVGPARVPIVPAAILFDLLNGGDKTWDHAPYFALGEQAYRNAASECDIGTVGAGFGALCGATKGGLGSASCTLTGKARVGALMVANPVGNVVNLADKRFWAAPFEVGSEFGNLGLPKSSGLEMEQSKLAALHDRANTTIGVIATDLALDKSQLQRVATAAHDGIARAIVPSHLPHDGDLIFALSTGKRPFDGNPLVFAELCHQASLTVARAIARGVYEAQPEGNDLLPTAKQLCKLL